MPFDPQLSARLEAVFRERFAAIKGLSETRMMGGFGYLLNGNMCVGIHKDTLIVRVGTDTAAEILKEPHVRPMDFTGKIMKGWATIETGAITDDENLARYCRPEEGEKLMARWHAWVDELGDASLNPGNPVSMSKTVDANGVSDDGGANPLSGYSFVKADSIDEAVALTKGCPHLEHGTIEVAEVMDIM